MSCGRDKSQEEEASISKNVSLLVRYIYFFSLMEEKIKIGWGGN